MLRHARGVLAILLVIGTASAATAQGNGKPQGTPNAVKYSNSGLKPGTGRAGSASLEARALIAQNGTMQIEASTGSLEDGVHPGSIAKTQVKIFTGETFVNNFNNLSGDGYWTGTFSVAGRGDKVQVQANVRGIDPKRTDVVTVTTTAALRPDIKVNSVTGPSQAAPQSSVGFAASVSEGNGDVGARTDCVMSVNGTDVASADGIWVDAAGNVSCAFNHVFATPGTYTVRVSASNVAPGDWDTSNNQAETTITILEPGKEINNGGFHAVQYNAVQEGFGKGDNPAYPYFYSYLQNVNYSYGYMWGQTQDFAGLMDHVDASLYTNGNVTHETSLTPNYSSNYDDGTWYSHCANYDSFVSNDGNNYVYGGDWAQMCASGQHNNPQSQWVSFYYQRVSGSVTYFSKGTECYWWGCNVWFYNQTVKYGSGTDMGWGVGSTVRLKLKFVDAIGKAYTADRSVTLQDHSWQVNNSGENWWYDWNHNRTIYQFWKNSGQYFVGQINWNQ